MVRQSGLTVNQDAAWGALDEVNFQFDEVFDKCGKRAAEFDNIQGLPVKSGRPDHPGFNAAVVSRRPVVM